MIVEDKGIVKKDSIDTTKMLSAARNSYRLIKFHIIEYKVFFNFRIDHSCSVTLDTKSDIFITVQVLESSLRGSLVNYAC